MVHVYIKFDQYHQKTIYYAYYWYFEFSRESSPEDINELNSNTWYH